MTDRNSRQCFYCKEYRSKQTLVFEKTWHCVGAQACQSRIDAKYVRRPDVPSLEDLTIQKVDRAVRYVRGLGVDPARHLDLISLLMRGEPAFSDGPTLAKLMRMT